jgi:hypothetical protein
MKFFKELYEDVKVITRNPNAKLLAKNYIKVYKDTYRGAPDMTDGKIGEFILKGKDEKFLADLLKTQFKDVKVK